MHFPWGATVGAMRGGVRVWKIGTGGSGARAALEYLFKGNCDASVSNLHVSHSLVVQASGAEQAAEYGLAEVYGDLAMERFTVTDGGIAADLLDADQVVSWLDGVDPITGQQRGQRLVDPDSAMMHDMTINFPKTYSLAGMMHPELAVALERLQDRTRNTILTNLQHDLNARRGQGGKFQIGLAQLEVGEVRHKRSRAMDPHEHRHLWINARVQGIDGKWSSLDSNTLFAAISTVNGIGELAQTTDIAWRGTLARFGLSLDSRGEIAELAHLVPAMSKRHRQIEANRARLLAEWEAEHPGADPSYQVMQRLDNLAWNMGRPNKPVLESEADWVQEVQAEIRALDAEVFDRVNLAGQLADMVPDTPLQFPKVTDLDVAQIAENAVLWADARSMGTRSRFSLLQLRAGAMYAVAATHAVGTQTENAAIVHAAVQVALQKHVTNLAKQITPVPNPTVKAYRATSTVLERARLDQALQVLATTPPTTRGPDTVTHVTLTSTGPPNPYLERLTAIDTARANQDTAAFITRHPHLADRITQIDHAVNSHRLSAQQAAAAVAIASNAPLVTIIGPAGSGKTTMMKVANQALHEQGRRMVIVAPSKKAALIAGEKTGAHTGTNSLHSLLYAYGYRWQEKYLGGAKTTNWSRLTPGSTDPATGMVYTGPPDQYRLEPGDRIVVDEAGMMDQTTALALARIALETKTGLAYVGDPYQLLPVGHSGAMQLATKHANHTLELDTIHRFRTPTGEPDHAYAALTLQMRTATTRPQAEHVANLLLDTEHVRIFDNDTAAKQFLVESWLNNTVTRNGRTHRASAAISCATNERAQEINTLIQQGRIDRGELDTRHHTTCQHGQTIYTGDRIQVRHNTRTFTNREEYLIRAVHEDGSVTAQLVGEYATTTNQPTRNIPAEYLTAHAHLAYAATAHGLQGATEHHGYADTGVALYVPMTRGEKHNTAIIIARDRKTAIASLTDQILQSQEEITPKQLAANLHRELMKVGERVTTTDTTLAESATDTNAVAATNALRAAQITALTPTERERADQHFTHHHTEWHHHITTDTDTATNPTTDNPATDAMDGQKPAVRNYQADIITGRRLLAEQVRRVRVINPDPDDTPQPDITTDTPSISL
ncbi:MAG: hypothetical protein B5766_00350 [Candidatus Lumbricidophila eiseniae]|uniref:TrwC relaxase domain-containing protein n=1 Tax=Candidatus Lumbricidiphila eiseniae TaxID=1969409 RepID=A0A2A6FUY0_9MICO|nr:MAG: hypothetical protein B5766_00350 [Candidatus Lumbricidophila eiseniae]